MINNLPSATSVVIIYNCMPIMWNGNWLVHLTCWFTFSDFSVKILTANCFLNKHQRLPMSKHCSEVKKMESVQVSASDHEGSYLK